MRRLFASIPAFDWEGTVAAKMERGEGTNQYQVSEFRPELSLQHKRILENEDVNMGLETSHSRKPLGNYLLHKSGTMLRATRIVRSIV
ncbi:hypothetical protein KC909_03995 [Candidatus Dojkabacteria bacterium]|uniref:Uncharacterized protein n=1 Tax=Candidatus Dojkabacteria bacterium TaxID=2099670 RepID=A0A955RJ75_9BACT|nr:hypothetical protein [Candidatus Dojkabacteria bacterium]